ncbi:bacteriophage T4 gp5 trimerisation domain-containing protein [Paraburkholderia unamae]|uniref:bacteriophage T4 gp5 trimerisation domain-containing protein n=1 Tax=Paraburkholderia unamae TaxID=219649 RepID=UPI0025B67C3F|nr:RHS repeat-associated core domain-containing protein [Paraburkholderia unamae]
MGRLYNAATLPPWPLPGNATQSGILTRSSKGGGYGNANAIRFEDKKGQEQLWVQAERNMDTVVEHDETHTVGHDRTKTIGHDETDHIGRNWKLNTDGWKWETIDLAAVQNVGLGQMLNVGLAYNVNVGGLYLRNVALQMASTVGMDRHDRVAQNWSSDVGHTYTLTVRGKAVGDAVQKDLANPVEATPAFAPNLPAQVESAENNQLSIRDSGEAHLSGAKQAQLIGPGGKVTIDDAGITLEGKGIYLKAPVISMSGGSAGGLAPVTEADSAPSCGQTPTSATKATSCNPVDLATGQKVLAQADFVLPGRIPIAWGRSYRSADQRTGALGAAWRLPYSTEIRRDQTQLTYHDADGRRLRFPLLEPGQEHFHVIEKYTLARGEDSPAGATYAVRFGNGVEEHYALHPTDDARWQLQRVTDRDANVLSLGYTPEGWLKEVRNNVHTVRCALDGAGRITAVSLVGHGNSLLAGYAYDANGDLREATDRAGRTWRYEYRNHLLTGYRTPSGAVHMSEWDGETPQARVTRTFAYVDDEAARQGGPAITRDTRFAYQSASSTTRVTDGLGRTTEYHYNGLWAVDRILYPDGSTYQTHFDETGSISGHTDELGRTTQIVNDARGNPTTVIDAAGNITRMSYNDQNLPVLVTDPAGQVWQRAYDDAGHLTAQTDPLGNTTKYAYEKGLPVTRTDALGNVTRMQYNDAGQLVARTDCSGHTTTYRYDGEGRLTATRDPLGNETLQHWDSERDRLGGIKPAGLGGWNVSYDDAGRVTAQTDPLSRITRTQWDAYNQRTTVNDPAGGTQGYRYDTLGRLTTLTNANGEQTTFEYDSRDRLVAQTGFDGRRQTYRYSAAGEVIARTDHGTDGQITTDIAYDALGRPVERHSTDGTHASYRYDARGLLTQAQATAPGETPSQVTFEYDAAGRRAGEMQAHHGQVWRIAHELDALGHRSATHLPDAGTLKWQRYGSGHVHGVLFNGEALAAFERDALHRETLRTQGEVSHHFAYSPAGLLASHHWQGIDSRGNPAGPMKVWRSWEHDRAGQITALHDAMRDSRAYTYDPVSRLTGVAAGRVSEAFSYDPAGNLLAVGHGKPTHVGRAHGDRLQVLVTPELPVGQSPQYAYDGHGNRTSVTVPQPDASQALTTAYRYDGTHQLKGIEHADGGMSRYEYDALGRRTAKHHTDASGRTATTLFVWDGSWMAQEIRAGQGRTAPITYVAHPNLAGPLARLDGAQAYHYVTDHLGTPQEIYDDRRQVVWAADLSAYGKTRSYLKHEVNNPIRFPGQYFDVESGLHYNRFRYYDPQAGRYITKDPISLMGGTNEYSYVAGNPVQRSDYLGLYFGLDDLVFSGGGAVVGVIGQGVGDLISWQLSGWEDYAGSAVGGAAGGEALLYTGPVGAGIAGGLTTNLTKQGLKHLTGKQCHFNFTTTAVDTAIGAATGFIPGAKIPGITSGRGSFNSIFEQMATKAQNGTASSITGATATKMFVGRSVDTALIPGTGAGAVAGVGAGKIEDYFGVSGDGQCTSRK